MKRRFVFCLGAMLFAGTLAAQTPVPEWQAGVDKVKSLIKANPEQASDAAGELLKGKNKKNVELVTSVARAYLDAGQLKEAETYLEMARKADNKAPAVSVLEGDIAFARKDIGKACQLYEQAIYFDSNYKDAYLKYAQAYKSASPSQAIEKLNQLKAIAPDCLEADKELAEVYYATNRFGKAADTYAKFIDTPVATEDDILKYAFALFLNHDFEKSLAVAQKGLQKNARHAAFNRLVMYNNVDLKRYDEAEKAADAFFNASDNADYSCLDYRYHGFTEQDLNETFNINHYVYHRDNIKLGDLAEMLKETYCGSIGLEFMHVQDMEQKSWLQSKLESQLNKPLFTKEEKINFL